MNSKLYKKNIIILFFLVLVMGFENNIYAADCGDADYDGITDTVCACGDTVVGADGYTYQLTEDLNCTGDGLIVWADGITIDGNGYTLTGDGEIGDYGINNSGGYDSITIKNFADINNFGAGIYLKDCTGSTVQNNTTNSNLDYGIYLDSSSSNIITNNIANLNGSANPLCSQPICSGIYLSYGSDNYLNSNTANSNGIWGIILYRSNNNNITGNMVNSNHVYGIQLDQCDSDTINSNIANSNGMDGIYLYTSTLCAIENNYAKNNSYTGIRIREESSDNTVTGNTVISNQYGFHISQPNLGLLLSENTILNNRYDIHDRFSSNIYSSNYFNGNINNKMLIFTEVDTRTKNVGETINFSISAFNSDGTDCSNCATITTSPLETVIIDTEIGNDINGHFTVTRPGTYSLNVTVTDTNSNTTKRNCLFFVGNIGTQTTRYYFRGTDPAHGQPVGNLFGRGSMLFTVPTSTEEWAYDSWTQNSPDEVPDYPFAYLSGIDIYSWYKQSLESEAYIGVQRYLTLDSEVDDNSSVPIALDYNWINKNFTDLNWAMDYSHSWYWLALKLYGTNPYWATFPSGHSDQPSYADFSYQYTVTPAIKSISDENIIFLSATANPDDTGSLSIVLEDVLTLDTSTMDIVLSSPVRLDISIDTWNISYPYYKRWTEGVSESGITGAHVISGFAPNSCYIVKKDGVLVGLYLSNNLGEITFTCPIGSVFTIEGSSDDDNKPQCFLTTLFATAGTDENRILCEIRDFRDKYLITNPIGEFFVSAYYKTSPVLAEIIRKNPTLKEAVKCVLNPLIWVSREITE